jgi:hypothetical protein
LQPRRARAKNVTPDPAATTSARFSLFEEPVPTDGPLAAVSTFVDKLASAASLTDAVTAANGVIHRDSTTGMDSMNPAVAVQHPNRHARTRMPRGVSPDASAIPILSEPMMGNLG